MELVRGVHITRFCDDAQLTPRERLELFIPVCQAIQHAHQKGIIHRDIKPSNILVSLYDGRPVPKVIDFGVAKATQGVPGERLTDKTMFTQFGQIGTLEYMSPEQAVMNQLDIDTRSDVYSLGAVLYELLTGTPPFERSRLQSSAFDEILRIIREEEPPLPSLRLSSSEKLATISAQRKTEPARLSRLVHGELDWIVMKALDKQRGRRYESASALARDVERYLLEEPVEAGPPSASYRIRKLANRYRRPLSVAAAFLALLAGTAIFSSVQWGRATNAAIAAREAKEQVIKDRDEKERQRSRAVEAEHAAQDERQRAEQSAAQARRNLYTAHMQQIQLEWDRSNIARIRELLARYAKPSDENEDLRGWEWHYWTRMCEQDLRTLKGHEGAAGAVAFNSDGSLVASAGQDGKVCVWNVGDGKLVRTIKAHEGAATCVAFHENKLASGGYDRRVRLWDMTDGRELVSFQYGNTVACVAFSSDGKMLAVGATSHSGGAPTPGKPVERRIIDVATSKELHRLDAEHDAYDLAFTQDASQLVIAATPNLEFWNAHTGELLKEVGVDEVRDNNLEFQPTAALALSRTNEFFVTASRDQLVRIRRFGDAEPTTTYRGHTGALMTVALSPDERVIASAGADNAIILWDIETGEEIRRLRGHEKGIMCIRFSPDGLRLASASNDGTVKIWDAVEPTDFRPFLTGTRGHHKAEAFSHDGRLYAVSHFLGSATGPDNTFFQWVEVREAMSGRRAFHVTGQHGWIDAVAFSHDGSKLATGARDRTVKIYDVATRRERHTLDGFTHWWIGGIAFSPDDRWLRIETPEVDAGTGRGHFTQQVWNASTGTRAATFPATGFAFHPQEHICAAAFAEEDKYAVHFYRTDQPLEGQTPFRSWTLDEAASGVRYDRRGKRLAANLGNKVIVWDVADGNVLASIANAGAFLGFDELGERLFTQTEAGKLSAWRTDSGDLMCEVTLPPEGVFMTVSISRDGTRIAARNLRFNQLMELGPLDEEARNQLEARNLAAHLLKFPTQMQPYITQTKVELLRDVSHLATISENVRRATAELLNDIYTPEEEATQLGSHGVDLILKPGKSRAEYEEGLKWTKAAAELDREHWEFEYGFALYRLERYQEALRAIESSQSGEMKRDARVVPVVLAAQAMTQFQLGTKEAAVATLAKAKADEYAALPDNLEIVREAKALIEPDNHGEEDMASGTSFARSGRWEEAVAAFARAEKQLAGNLRAECLYYLALAQIAAGDREAHRRVCSQLAADFDIANDAFAAGRLAYASVLNPNALDDWSALVEVSEKHQMQSGIRAALRLRAGDYQGALELLPPERANIGTRSLAYIAMAQHFSGHAEEARKALADCEKNVKLQDEGKVYSNDWDYRLESRLLCEEAKRLIMEESP
jgi:WD40 repeat protein